jgi:hypothetical protein
MDRFTHQDASDFQYGIVNIDLDVTLGTNGATTGATINYGDGILSIVLSGTGVYTVTFQDGYIECLNIIENIIQASYSASGAVYFTWTTEYAYSAGPPAAATVVLTARTAAGAAVTPATGDRIKLTFRMKRSR